MTIELTFGSWLKTRQNSNKNIKNFYLHVKDEQQWI